MDKINSTKKETQEKSFVLFLSVLLYRFHLYHSSQIYHNFIDFQLKIIKTKIKSIHEFDNNFFLSIFVCLGSCFLMLVIFGIEISANT